MTEAQEIRKAKRAAFITNKQAEFAKRQQVVARWKGSRVHVNSVTTHRECQPRLASGGMPANRAIKAPASAPVANSTGGATVGHF